MFTNVFLFLENLPDGLQTDCSKCSEKQKDGAIKVIKYLVKNRRPIFDELSDKFDKDRTYLNRHKEEFEKEGIKV